MAFPGQRVHRVWEGFFDLPTIAWAGIWAVAIHVSMRSWKKLRPGQQYLLVVLPFTAALIAPCMIAAWFAYTYWGDAGAIAVAGLTNMSLILLWGPNRVEGNESDEPILRRFEHKYFTVRILWQNDRHRQCKSCGRFDNGTRDTTLPPSNPYSAFSPCWSCKGTEFDYFLLDDTPVGKA
jgi:hypothetical protein